MKSFGNDLANELSAKPPIKSELCFHLAGFEQTQNGRFPAAYKIINAPDGKFTCYCAEPPYEYKKGTAPKCMRGGEKAVVVSAVRVS